MASLAELGKIFEQIGRLHLKAGKLLMEVDVDPAMLESKRKKIRITAGVQQVWDRYCEARAQFYRAKHNLVDNHVVTPPALTPQRVKLITDAINRHGLERVKRAAIGLFLSDWHTGKNEHGKAYLEPERPFQLKGGKDMVDYFADVYVELHGEF